MEYETNLKSDKLYGKVNFIKKIVLLKKTKQQLSETFVVKNGYQNVNVETH